MFKDGAGITVNQNGSLTAIGSTGNVILFTSESGKRGSWKGISILSSSAKNILSFCKIEQAGAANTNGSADILVGSANTTAEVQINNCEITTSAADGILLSEGSKLDWFNNNNIHTNTAHPISMHVTDAVNLSRAC